MTAEKISELLKEKNVDAALVSSPANIRYTAVLQARRVICT